MRCESMKNKSAPKKIDLEFHGCQDIPQNHNSKKEDPTGEYSLICYLHKRDLLLRGGAIFDVGANVGDWSTKVLEMGNAHPIHMFEPISHTYRILLRNFCEKLADLDLFFNNCAVGQKEELRPFFYYQDGPAWSTFYRREQIEKQSGINPPEVFPVPVTTLDRYCDLHEVKHITFLKIDAKGDEMGVFKGAKRMFQEGKIDYVQFEYGKAFPDAGIKLTQVFKFIEKYDYALFRLSANKLEYIPQFLNSYENIECANFLAVNGRLKSLFLKEPPTMLDLRELCDRYSVAPRGVLHIGAHEGEEKQKYMEMGIQKAVFVEANPIVFERLKTNIQTAPSFIAVNCAISNKTGVATLHLTSMDQSSSILPLKRHKEIYPQIKETDRVSVSSTTIDRLLQDLNLSPTDFNILNIDIQGAELLALEGAEDTLKYVDAINTEVNYEELYEGCALIGQIDDFLGNCGFVRVKTKTPFHPSWGDAFYVKRPVISMSTLGKNGRFANQIFQYAFLKIYAKKFKMKVETPQWIGEGLFGCKDDPISKQFPVFQEQEHKTSKEVDLNSKEPLRNVDVWGYFQYHTRYYADHKSYFRSLFQPTPLIRDKLKGPYNTLDLLRTMNKTIVGLHLRRGDFGQGYSFIAPAEWYKEWLEGFWDTLVNPVLFIASDEPDKVLKDFSGYNPATSLDLGITLPGAEFYPDFFLLSQCDVLAISNSSYSFAAAMLNERANIFFRPHFVTRKLIPFDPWNSEPILRDMPPADIPA